VGPVQGAPDALGEKGGKNHIILYLKLDGCLSE
jgi:hypothetical protein